MTGRPPRSSGDILREARQRDSRTKRTRVLQVVEHMLERDEAITFAAVARTARVSNWLVYAAGVREHILTARQQQAGQPRQTPADHTAGPPGLQAELAIMRQANARTRKENHDLREQLRRQLGHQVDQLHTPDLIARINELTAQAEAATTTIEGLRHDNQDLTTRLEQAENDLLAARASLRRMIREHNASAETPAAGQGP